MPITEQVVIERLVDAAITIGPARQEYLRNLGGESPGPYGDAGVVAHHAVFLASNGSEDELRSIFQAVETMLTEERTPGATNLLIVGLLEDIQNIASHPDAAVPSSSFVVYLWPYTADAWWRLHESWGSEDT